ncbi:DUF2911 domain-containing protein [Kordia sp. YSTF-M3]|uniref:DUF2911 domain-containing protein n=1 Tax=Kordia aestuariivivens TaxID=2759037 RepID=A0ABR7Q7B7_9FLAO|nr:DUF2911 domain-containing protein [Kordia aestuariivivens]MBC8754328.1 DUF2911 domain-containing protein [Kordia aestuariivivens]
MRKIMMMLAFFAAVSTVNAQDFPKADKSPTDIAHYPTNAAKRAFAKTDAQKKSLEPKIRVIYARPYKKGREVFGNLLKFDKAWRVGANESTEVLFMTDVMIGDSKVKAGRYSVIIIPTKDSWTLKINTENDGWGNYSYDASKDVASITVPTQKSDTEIEQLSIVLYEKSKNVIHLKIGWDTTIAEFPITLK